MRRSPRVLLLALVAVAPLAATGCSYAYYFDLTVTVVNATDGTPLPDARITLDFPHHVKNGEVPAPTDAAGRTTHFFGVSVSEFDDHRRANPLALKVERNGFVPQVVNIK